MDFKRVLFIAFLLYTAQSQNTGIKQKMENDLTYVKTRMQSLTTDAIFFAKKFETEQRQRRETERRMVHSMHNLTEQNIKLESVVSNLTEQNSKLESVVGNLRERNTKLEHVVNNLTEQNIKIESKLNNTIQEAAQLKEDLNNLSSKTILLENQLGITESNNLRLETELKSANSTIFRLEYQLNTVRVDYIKLAGQISGISSDNARINKQLTSVTAGNVRLDEDLKKALSDLNDTSTVVKKLSTPVSFSAYVSSSNNLAVGDIIPFKIVRNNKGNHYNPSTGVFTAPVDGIYFFYSAITTTEYGQAVINVNGSKESYLLIRGKPQEADMVGNSLIIHLTKGSNVHVAFSYMSKPPMYVYHRWSTFSGFLIKAD